MKHRMKLKPNIHQLSKENSAVIDMPMKLMISLIIGSLTLATIIGFITQSSILPASLYVTIQPTMSTINDSTNTSFFHIMVKDSSDQQPIHQGLVTIKGHETIAYNYTNKTGKCIIPVTIHLEDGINELFLDVQVKASGYDPCINENMIRIIRD